MDKHYSSTLATVLTNIVPSATNVLDLGPLTGGTTDIFLQKKCRCYVEDLVEYLEVIESQGVDPKQALDEHLLPKPESLKFSVILCWDLLNYLSLDTIGYLFSKLERHCSENTIVHFIRYSGNTIPEKPKRFKMQNDFNFELIDEHSKDRIQNQSHSTVNLLKRFEKFSIRSTSMNQQGMQKDMVEYLLEYKTKNERSVRHGVKQAGLVSYFEEKEQSHTLNLPCLSDYFSKIDRNDPKRLPEILDIGKNTSRNLEFLDLHSKKLLTEDVFSSIAWQKKLNGEGSQYLSDFLLRLDSEVELDLVLCWDIFNYCLPFQIEKLCQLITQRLKLGGKMHVILFRHTDISKSPATFEIKDCDAVKMMGNITGDGSGQVQTITGLMKIIRQFNVVSHKTVRVKDAVSFQELLLEFKVLPERDKSKATNNVCI